MVFWFLKTKRWLIINATIAQDVVKNEKETLAMATTYIYSIDITKLQYTIQRLHLINYLRLRAFSNDPRVKFVALFPLPRRNLTIFIKEKETIRE